MKKKSLLLFPILFLMGCSEVRNPEYFVTYRNDLPIVHRGNSTHTTYLMLSQYGRLSVDGELLKGGDVEEKYYENCIVYEAAIGEQLPVAVSTIDDVVFRGWFKYTNKVYAEQITVPVEDGDTLFAIFDGPTGGSGGIITEGYGLKFSDGTKVGAVDKGEEGGYHQYLVSNYTFEQGKSFGLYDFGKDLTWTVDLNPWSFGDKDGTGTIWKTYLSKSDTSYTILKTFTADVYIKLKYEADNVYFELK